MKPPAVSAAQACAGFMQKNTESLLDAVQHRRA
jgi:hypothetical protein